MNLVAFWQFLILLATVKVGFAYIHWNGSCSTDKGSERELCDYNRGLTCMDYNGQFVCRCVDETKMTYDATKHSCVVFLHANRTWVIGDRNVKLNCKDHSFLHSIFHSDIYSFEKDDRCKCYDGRLPEMDTLNPDNRCLPTYGLKCYSDVPCHPQSRSVCVGGSCSCPHPMKQYGAAWNKSLSICQSIPGIPHGCLKDSPEEWGDCIPNAVCGDDEMCHCRPGFTLATEESTVKCLLSHHGNCSSTKSAESDLCNEKAGLVCRDNKCVCLHEPDAIFDEVSQECVAIEGSPCTLPNVKFTGRNIPCQSGLECMKIVPGGLMGLGVCVKIQ